MTKQISEKRKRIEGLLNQAILSERDSAAELYPAYASAHEAYAVLLDTSMAVDAAIKRYRKDLDEFWAAARMHEPSEIIMKLALVRESATHIVTQAVRATAIAHKAADDLKETEDQGESEPEQVEIGKLK